MQTLVIPTLCVGGMDGRPDLDDLDDEDSDDEDLPGLE